MAGSDVPSDVRDRDHQADRPQRQGNTGLPITVPSVNMENGKLRCSVGPVPPCIRWFSDTGRSADAMGHAPLPPAASIAE